MNKIRINNLINMAGLFLKSIESNPKQGLLVIAGVAAVCYAAIEINDRNNAHEMAMTKEYLDHDLPELCRNLNNDVSSIEPNDQKFITNQENYDYSN